VYWEEKVVAVCDASENVELPPMLVRSQLTTKPVEDGLVPGTAVALNVIRPPAVTGLGVAEPLLVGLVVSARPRMEMSSMDSAWELVTVVPVVTE
jgi:hypothetical protein